MFMYVCDCERARAVLFLKNLFAPQMADAMLTYDGQKAQGQANIISAFVVRCARE